MMYKTKQIGGLTVRLRSKGENGPVVYWPVAGGCEQQLESVARLLSRSLGDAEWTLVAFECENWNRDYSPWALPDTDRRQGFTGGAKETLAWLKDACIPAVEGGLTGMPCRMIGGYSLAGMFSLYAFYESGLFRGAAGCSSSLWYPGWRDYITHRNSPPGSCLYLSLGRREEKTRDPEMATVGDMTRLQHELAQNDPNIRASELCWHNGGHFTEVDQRIAQGFAWLIRQAGA